MGFNPPVPQQDSNWEIRVALLLSLFLQVLLIFLGPMRKRLIGNGPRFVIWSCYLLADWVADLGLGLILNNMGNIGGGGGNSTSSFGLKRGGGGATTSTAGNNSIGNDGSPIIFAFWTPFLLLHLGGPDTITSYSLEDNELWLRHLIGLLFELFSACVIFFCSLRGNPLIHATVLMFVAGIIKYGERTYSLYRGSLEMFRANILGRPDPGRNYARFMTEFDSRKKAGLDVEIVIPSNNSMNRSSDHPADDSDGMVSRDKDTESQAYAFFGIFRRLFVDLVLSSKQRRMARSFFLDPELKAGEAFEIMEMELGFIFDMVYTKGPVAHTRMGCVLRAVCSVCIVSALVVFFHVDKQQHKVAAVDVSITYALLLGGLTLDQVALAMLLLSDRAAVFFQKSSSSRLRRWFSKWLRWLREVPLRWLPRRHWSRSVAQCNLIGYCIRSKMLEPEIRHQPLGKIRYYTKRYTVKEEKKEGDKVVQTYRRFPLCFFKRMGISRAAAAAAAADIKESSVLYMLFHRAKRLALDSVDIEEVLYCRGKVAIDRLATHIKMNLSRRNYGDDDSSRPFNLIMDSVVNRDFDESLLLWHIATDLCRLEDKERAPTETEARVRPIALTLSEYMLYLLIKQPEMLSTRTGIWLMRYQDTCEEAQRFFGSMAEWNPHHKDARRMLLSINTERKPLEVKGDQSKSVLFDAVILAKALRELDEELRWGLLSEVWMAMLLEAAHKCPGSTHARGLNRGGELITIIWFLMEHMGLGNAHDVKTVDVPAKLIVHY